jgi:hypothetical protein
MSDTIKPVRKKHEISAAGRKKMAQAGRTKNPKKGFGSNPELARKVGGRKKQATKV